MKFNESAHGTVVLKDLMKTLDGRWVNQVTGTVQAVAVADVVGFKTKGSESNWVAMIRGDGQVCYVLGCQIRAFVEHDPSANPAEAWVLP